VPRMFRAMKKSEDDKPTVGRGFCELGVRTSEIDTDSEGNAIPNEKGMSVAPHWRLLSLFVMPRRLVAGGRGKNTHCFRRGDGEFRQEACGNGLELVPDSVNHGVVRPAAAVPLATFLQDLANTRDEWVIDES